MVTMRFVKHKKALMRPESQLRTVFFNCSRSITFQSHCNSCYCEKVWLNVEGITIMVILWLVEKHKKALDVVTITIADKFEC